MKRIFTSFDQLIGVLFEEKQGVGGTLDDLVRFEMPDGKEVKHFVLHSERHSHQATVIVSDVAPGRSITKEEAIEWFKNPKDNEMLVAKGIDGDDDLFTEIVPSEDDIENLEDGTYYEFQIWSKDDE